MKTVLISFVCFLLFTQNEIPYKAKDEFELKLDFQFKTRSPSQPTYSTKKVPTGPLPYLVVHLNVLKVLPDELRIRVVDMGNTTLAAKNLSKSTTMKFDLGYTDDLKDQVSSHQYFVNFYDGNKNIKRNIVILFEKDGTFFVNGEKRGKI